jgi:hypothetical protein
MSAHPTRHSSPFLFKLQRPSSRSRPPPPLFKVKRRPTIDFAYDPVSVPSHFDLSNRATAAPPGSDTLPPLEESVEGPVPGGNAEQSSAPTRSDTGLPELSPGIEYRSLSTNDNDYRIEPYRLIDNQPDTHNLPQNPFGRVDDGYLEIESCIEEITELIQITSPGCQTPCIGTRYAAKRCDDLVAECQPDFKLEDLEHWPGGSKLSLMLLAESFKAANPMEIPWLTGLILSRDPAGCGSRFVRVGIFRIRDKSTLFSSCKPQRIVVA